MKSAKKPYKRLKNATLKQSRTSDQQLPTTLDPAHYGVVLSPASQLTYKFMADLVDRFAHQQFSQPAAELAILDWGCGKAQLSYFLHQAGYTNITLAEVPNYPHRALWPSIAKVELELNHPHRINTPDKSFDIIVCAGVLEHVPSDLASLQELQRIIKDDGLIFCFNLPTSSGLVHRLSHARGDYYHDRLYSKKEVTWLLKRAGLKPLVLYRRQFLPKKAINYKHPERFDRLDNQLSRLPGLNLLAASIEFVAVNQNCHLQAG